MTPTRSVERLALRDGSSVEIRPLEREDAPLVRAIFAEMSDDARYSRFLGTKKKLSRRDVETLTDVDHHGHEALVALDAGSGGPVGVARMIRVPSRPETAEASVAVVDAWQGRGVGGALLERLVGRAREEGVRAFTSVLLTRNVKMLHLFERVGAVRIADGLRDTLELEVDLPFATDAPREALRAAAATGRVREG